MKKIFVSFKLMVVISLITYFIVTPDVVGNFTVPSQLAQGVQCAGCIDIWDGKGQFVDMMWNASP